MAQLAPFGFQAGQSRRSVNEYYVAASDTSTLAVGDPVKTNGNVFVGRLPDSRVSKGMLHVTKAASGQAIRGVIVGIVAGPGDNSLQSLPATKTRPYCVLVNDNPQALWDVQADNAAPLSAMAGMYASYAVGAPLGSVSSTVVDADSISATASDLLIAEVLRNDGANSLLRVAFVQHEMAAAGGSPQIGAQIQALVSGDGIGRRIVLGLLGDSLHNRTHTTSSLSAEPTYDATTGVASFAQSSHGHFTGMLCRITNTAGDMFDNLSLVRVDANTFSVAIGPGLTLPGGETWYISLRSGYHAESPVTHLRPARPVLRNYAASGAAAGEIRSKLLPLAVAGDANVVWLRAGTNDGTGGVAAVAGVLADVTFMAQQIVESGRTLILSTLPPYGSTAAGGAFTANMAAGIRALARTLRNCYLIDEHLIGVNPASTAGAARTGYQVSDNTHFTPLYARLVGQRLQTILDSINPSVSPCPTSALDAYDGTNNTGSTQPFPTPTLTTTSGGTNGSTTPITGTVAANLTVYASGGFTAASVTASVGTGAWGNGVGNYQQLVASPTADNDLLRITTRAAESTVAGLVTAGERRKGVCHVRVTGLTGQAVLQSLLMYVVFTNAEGTFSTRITDQNWGGASNTAAQITQADIDMDMETGDFIVPAGVTSLYLDVQLKFDAAGTAVTFQVGQPAFPLVPAA